jgi:hypothetical protein
MSRVHAQCRPDSARLGLGQVAAHRQRVAKQGVRLGKLRCALRRRALLQQIRRSRGLPTQEIPTRDPQQRLRPLLVELIIA